MATITIAYSNHRPETLPFTEKAMARHQVVFLEEAPDPGFGRMLDGRLAVDDYVAELDTEYPEFSRLSCRMLRRLHAKGTRLEQVEPFVDRLIQIHDRFASGQTPGDIMGDAGLMPVYAAEKEATRTLIDFYGSAAGQPFADVLAALKAFAVADALRFRLRDRMRAEALARRVRHFSSVYVEAGTMHLWLRRCIKRRLGDRHDIRSRQPMAAAVRAVTGRSYLMGPGDELTLRYIFNPRAESSTIDLLAARSLIFNKILAKTEMLNAADDCPHIRDEWRALKTVNRLQRRDCETLFERIRGVGTLPANALVAAYLAQ